jgi:hypothetical protein
MISYLSYPVPLDVLIGILTDASLEMYRGGVSSNHRTGGAHELYS